METLFEKFSWYCPVQLTWNYFSWVPIHLFSGSYIFFRRWKIASSLLHVIYSAIQLRAFLIYLPVRRANTMSYHEDTKHETFSHIGRYLSSSVPMYLLYLCYTSIRSLNKAPRHFEVSRACALMRHVGIRVVNIYNILSPSFVTELLWNGSFSV